MEVIITKGYIRDLRFLPKEVRSAADAVIDLLVIAPTLQDSGVDYKKLSGQKKGDKYYRIRVGDWRIGIECINPTIVLITILSRGSIYKQFP